MSGLSALEPDSGLMEVPIVNGPSMWTILSVFGDRETMDGNRLRWGGDPRSQPRTLMFDLLLSTGWRIHLEVQPIGLKWTNHPELSLDLECLQRNLLRQLDKTGLEVGTGPRLCTIPYSPRHRHGKVGIDPGLLSVIRLTETLPV